VEQSTDTTTKRARYDWDNLSMIMDNRSTVGKNEAQPTNPQVNKSDLKPFIYDSDTHHCEVDAHSADSRTRIYESHKKTSAMM
jgi:hypothetical protein